MLFIFKIFKNKYIQIFLIIMLILFTNNCLFENKVFCNDKIDIVLYSSMKKTQLKALQKGFTNKYPEINMNYYSAGTGEIIDKILNEDKIGDIKADIMWIGDPTYYYILKERGILLPYESEEALTIPSALKDKDNYFCAARIVTLGLIYNTELVINNIPNSWNDLLKPCFNNKVIMTNPSISGTTFYTVAALIQNKNFGWNYIYDLKKNGIKIVDNSVTVIDKIAEGEFDIGIGAIYIAKTKKEEGYPVDFVYPQEGIIAVPSPITIFKSTKNVEAAKKLYDYIISIEGQLILMKENVIPVRPEVKLKDSINIKEAVKRAFPVNVNKLLYDKGKMLIDFKKIMNN
ncbi:MAG: ABC transporter substrate-binding protein [Actinobacteria bacterium]|nr:ABC transporter substrate-binding protein [Actinomycetota bacterium]MBU4510068.1 ABC transporter substrate-binding protein [bacterium]